MNSIASFEEMERQLGTEAREREERHVLSEDITMGQLEAMAKGVRNLPLKVRLKNKVMLKWNWNLLMTLFDIWIAEIWLGSNPYEYKRFNNN